MPQLSPMFQSAPLTKARGDSRPFAALRGRYRVSIRSPHKSKGRHEPSPTVLRSISAFQSAPLTKARGDPHKTIGGCTPNGDRVSIRSPHKSKGRRSGPWVILIFLAKFQSAPLTKARGDSGRFEFISRSEPRFNPLPSQKQGETLGLGFSQPRARFCFNPLPSQKQGETIAYS